MIQSAVDQAVQAAAEEPFGPEEQFDLLGLGSTVSSRAGELRVVRDGADKKRGRPPGARNKRTKEWLEYLSGRYRHPLETLALIQASGIDELAARLGCTKLEALQEIRVAGQALLPYMAQKTPIAVDVSERIVRLNINTGGVLPGDKREEAAPLVARVIRDLVERENAEDQGTE